MLSRNPEWLNTVTPTAMMVITDTDAANLSRMPQDRRRFLGELNVRRFVFEHQECSRMIHLVAGNAGTVAEEECWEGLVGCRGGDADDGFHFLRSVVVPAFEEFEELGPLVEVLGWAHWVSWIAVSLFPFAGGAEKVDDLSCEVYNVVGVHAEIRVKI